MVSDLTLRACDRAEVPRVGARHLRHTLGTGMCAPRSELLDIGQVLRHRDLATPALDATVNLATLRSIAQPFGAVVHSLQRRHLLGRARRSRRGSALGTLPFPHPGSGGAKAGTSSERRRFPHRVV